MDITSIAGIEKIDKYFYPHIMKMCSIANSDYNIEKMVAFGPIVNNEDIDKDTELFIAVYFNENYIKDFTEDDFVRVTADIEETCNMIWVCAPQNHRYDKSVSIKMDIARGVTIYESSKQIKEG